MNDNEMNNNGEARENPELEAQTTQTEQNTTVNEGTPDYNWSSDAYKKKKHASGKKVAVIMSACTLVIAILSFCVGAFVFGGNDDPKGIESNHPEVPVMSDDTANSTTENSITIDDSSTDKVPQHLSSSTNTPQYTDNLPDLYEKCSVSCATIYVKTNSGAYIGSGFVVSEDGYILTNQHLVEGAVEVTVMFYNGDKYAAKIVGGDSLSDIAVLLIEGEDLIPIELGDSNSLRVGDAVFTIGTPHNMNLAGTLTSGRISGLNRKLSMTDSYGTVTKTMTLIQTDSALNQGNSGGPLINMAGQVVGINAVKLNNNEGIAFAIPISSALEIANELIEYGEVRYSHEGLVTAPAKLNVTVASVSDARVQYGIPDSAPDGCIILQLARNSAIYKAGADLYDIITEFNGVKITSKDDLSTELAKCSAGQKATIKIYRIMRDGSGQTHELTFTLEGAA